MLKLIGALCIIGACCAFAAQQIIKKREALRAVRELHDLFCEIEHAISFQLVPLPDLINRLAQEPTAPALRFLQRLEVGIGDGPLRPLGEIWDEALLGYQNETFLPEKAQKIASALGSRLGQMDFETERDRLLSAANELEAFCAELDVDTVKTEKLTKSLGVLLGIFIVILLV